MGEKDGGRHPAIRFADPNTIHDDIYPFLTETAEITEGMLS